MLKMLNKTNFTEKEPLGNFTRLFRKKIVDKIVYIFWAFIKICKNRQKKIFTNNYCIPFIPIISVYLIIYLPFINLYTYVPSYLSLHLICQKCTVILLSYNISFPYLSKKKLGENQEKVPTLQKEINYIWLMI